MFHVPATKHDVVWFERSGQTFDDIGDVFSPLLFAEPLQTAKANIVFVNGFPIGKMADFHRLQHFVDDHRRAEARSQSQEKHTSAFVAAQRLDRRVVDYFNRASEGLLKIKTYPAGS